MSKKYIVTVEELPGCGGIGGIVFLVIVAFIIGLITEVAKFIINHSRQILMGGGIILAIVLVAILLAYIDSNQKK